MLSAALKEELHELFELYQAVCHARQGAPHDPQTDNLLKNSRFRIITRLLLIAFSTSDNRFRLYAEKIIAAADGESVCAFFEEIASSLNTCASG
jgi:hypothetical protein